MSNYNSQLQSNNTDLQTVLQTLQTKAAGSGSGSANVPSASTAEFGRQPIIEQAPDGKSYFNGVLLPDIPTTGFESTPYLMILKASSNGLALYGSTSKPYYTTRSDNESLELPSGRNRCIYDSENDIWGELQSSTSATWCDLSTNWTIIWSNFDISIGSASATDIYFKCTEPSKETPIGYGDFVSGAENYGVTSDSLNELAHRMQQKYDTYDLFTSEEIREFVMTPPLVEKDVNFYDYDGTLLYSYTLEELQGLTKLPPNASHDGLVGDGWNWTLERLKENNGPIDVAALYATEDGATWFDLENDFDRDIEVTFLWKQSEASGACIDFGDGSELYVTDSTGDLSVTHTYQPGMYRAKIFGSYSLRGTASVCCVNDIAAGGSSLLKRVFIGKTSLINAYSFSRCFKLETISLPNYCYYTGVHIFNSCTSLKFCYTGRRIRSIWSVSSGTFTDTYSSRIVSFGDNTTIAYSLPPSIERAAFAKTFAMDNCGLTNNRIIREILITDATTALPNYAFQNCSSLTKLTIPSRILTIGIQAFRLLPGLRRLRFEGITPPTVTNANAFVDVPTDCIVEVPAESLTAYQEATNYGTIAAQMVGV